MKIRHINAYEIDEVIFEDNKDILIIELEKISDEEINFLEENNILYKFNNNKVEIVILSFKTSLIEYGTKFKEGIYFENTELYYNYYEECHYVDEMCDDEKNLIICKDGKKVEILVILEKRTVEDDRKLFQEYFIDKSYYLESSLKNIGVEGNVVIGYIGEFKNIKFKNIYFIEVAYENNQVTVHYTHYKYKKKLILKNIESARTQQWTSVYYESLLDKMESETDFYKMINRAPKYNELYLIDINLRRVIIKFKGDQWNENWRS